MNTMCQHSHYFLEKFKPQLSGDHARIDLAGLSSDCRQDILQVLLENGIVYALDGDAVFFSSTGFRKEATNALAA